MIKTNSGAGERSVGRRLPQNRNSNRVAGNLIRIQLGRQSPFLNYVGVKSLLVQRSGGVSSVVADRTKERFLEFLSVSSKSQITPFLPHVFRPTRVSATFPPKEIS